MDSLYTSSVLAIRPKTGEIVCYYQYTPNDVYDTDGADENVLADVQIDGQTRKVMIQANKNGFMYVLDRTGLNAVPIGYNPNTGLVYTSTWNLPRIQKLAPPKPQVLGTDSTGVVARQPVIKPGDVVGYFIAINPLTGEKKWEVPVTDLPISAGTLVTDGGLMFTGKLTGEFITLDTNTGETLYQFKTGSSINATAITYTHKGRQYVTIASGLGGTLARRYAADKVPSGGSVSTFALMPE